MSSLKLKHSGGNSMSIEAPATDPASNLALKLPATIGSANQFLKNSGTAGTLGWSSVVEDSSGKVGIGTASPVDHIQTYDGSATTVYHGFTNSTTGATGNDGFRVGIDSNANVNIWDHENTYMNFGTNNTERMRIDSSGNVGIGTTSPQAKLQVNDTNPVIAEFYRSNGGTDDEARIALGAYSSNPPSQRGVLLTAINNGAGHDFSLRTSSSHSGGPTEKIKVTSSGTLAQSSGDTVYTASIGGAIRMQLVHTGGGDVTWSNPSSGSATYSTSSDYRLKQNVVDLPNAWSTVKALKPYEYKWKHNTSKTSQGFFAHEVIATVPNSQAGQGTKDAVDEDDKPIYQQIDYSKLVPVLTKALQEAITKIETLETKVAALEAG